ncbi:uncharacterized protein E5676_scaffold18G00170 [Cucumis melo var. makuwa]|uniref:Asp_protease_2 domain-containing protein n=1 Tax=Cucumis melo var. makuwa TaxID=1194695 RepID=A0A5D3BVG5_CUCMM|nr:uncharacterized protein E6C27_scaffold22G005360 [Cucumis melo var. makuwa]TYK02226.1 uncharacterized protein E5676_scaffold18G00170 [Cucumis melo var. makuwa]
MSEDFRATLDVVRNVIADVNARLNLTMRAMANQASVGGAIFVNKHFKATNIVTEEAKVTLPTIYLRMPNCGGVPHLEGTEIVAQVLLKMSGEANVPGPHLARECPNKADFHEFRASLTPDLNDNSNQAEGEVDQIEGGKKTRIGALKYLSSLQKKSGERNVSTERGLVYIDTWINQNQTKSTMVDSDATHNFITEAEARHLRLRWEKDSERMKVVNSVVLSIIRLVKQTKIKMGGWKGPVDFVVVQMDDFDVVLGMEFLLEHQVIPMPSAKYKNPAQEEPPSVAILLGALGKLGETVPKDALMIDHGIESPPEAKAPAKNVYRTMPPELAELRKQVTEAEGLETTCVTRLKAYEFLVVPFSLIDAKGGKCCFVQRQINVLGHVVEFHQIEVEKRKFFATCDGRITKSVVELRLCLGLVNSNGQFLEGFLKRASSLTELFKEEDSRWGGNLKCQAAFNDLKQTTIEGPSLGVPDATKPPKVEVEQFNCMLREYLHHFVDGRRRNWVQMLNVALFGHDAQTDSLIRRS